MHTKVVKEDRKSQGSCNAQELEVFVNKRGCYDEPHEKGLGNNGQSWEAGSLSSKASVETGIKGS